MNKRQRKKLEIALAKIRQVSEELDERDNKHDYKYRVSHQEGERLFRARLTIEELLGDFINDNQN